MNYFTNDLDDTAFKEIKKDAGDAIFNIYYVNKRLSKSIERKNMFPDRLKHVNFHLFPEKYHDFCRSVIESTEKVYLSDSFQGKKKKYGNSIDVGEIHMDVALKKSIYELIAGDCRIVYFSELVCDVENSVFLLKEPELLRSVRTDLMVIGNRRNYLDCFNILKWIVRSLLVVTNVNRNYDDSKVSCGILYEDRYGGHEGNPEFKAFYRYFKSREDVKYIIRNKDSHNFRQLENDGKPVFSFKPYISGYRNKLATIKDIVSLVWSMISSNLGAGYGFKISFLKYYEIYYESLFKTFNPRFYIKNRSDLYIDHPIATGVAAKSNVKNIGYSCGSYPYVTPTLTPIDFHYYGLLGRQFKEEIYNGFWSDDIEYSVLGPFTAEMLLEEKSENDIRNGVPNVISIFSTSVAEDLGTTFELFAQMVADVLMVFTGNTNRIIFKEKSYEKENNDVIRKSCNGRVDYEIYYHHDNVTDKVCRTQEIIDQSDIVIVMKASTTVYEALGKKKKLIIYEQEGVSNPFDQLLPSLVARNAKELKAANDTLSKMTQDEYEVMISKALNYASKPLNGKLVEEFITGIERHFYESSKPDAPAMQN